jgi:CheY-like chemotaxis protein
MRRILVVDDDPHICLAIRAWLKRYGFRVSIADGGVNGLAALDNAAFGGCRTVETKRSASGGPYVARSRR